MVLLSILRPREEIGRAFSQAPDSLVEAAKTRAIEVSLEALSNRDRRHLVGIPGLLAVGGGTNEGRGGHDPETTAQQHRPHRGEGHSGDEKEVV